MGATKELFELGLKSIKTPIKNFIDNGLSKIDGKSLVHMYKTDTPRFEKLYSDMDSFTKTNDENAAVSIIKSVEDYTAQRQQSAMAEQVQALTYTRPDAMQNLQAAGADRLSNMKRKPRTIQGPVPPQLADKTFDQGARSYEEAVMAGTTKFVDEAGIPTQIRNYGSDTAPHGRTTKVEVRKTSGRGKTSEGDRRKINEMLATDPTLTPAEKQAFGRIMAQAAAEGMDGDHIVEIARVANAVRDMTPAQRKAYFKNFREAGVALGNDPKNVQKLSKQENQVVKPAQLRAIDKAIQNMDKRGKSLLDEMLSSIQ